MRNLKMISKEARTKPRPDNKHTKGLSPYTVAYLAAIIGTLLILGLTVDNFATLRNLTNVLNQSAVLGVLAIGMTYVLVGAGIDLSMPANMAFAAILGTMLMKNGLNPIFAVPIMIAIGGGIGLINGFAIGKLQMIPFVVTLAMLTILSGTSVWMTKSASITGVSDGLMNLFATKMGPLQVSVLLLGIITAVASITMSNSIFGRQLGATGTNERAARVAGIQTGRVIVFTYLVSGLMAGVAGVFIISRLGSASASLGPDQIVLDVISSAVVGGVSIYGGIGKPYAAVLGAVFITAISNATNLIGVDYSVTLGIKGVIIILFVALDTLRRREEKVRS